MCVCIYNYVHMYIFFTTAQCDTSSLDNDLRVTNDGGTDQSVFNHSYSAYFSCATELGQFTGSDSALCDNGTFQYVATAILQW